jgi:hypothetical protein
VGSTAVVSPQPPARESQSTASSVIQRPGARRQLEEMEEDRDPSSSDDVLDEDDKRPNLDMLARAVAPLIKQMMKREGDRSSRA